MPLSFLNLSGLDLGLPSLRFPSNASCGFTFRHLSKLRSTKICPLPLSFLIMYFFGSGLCIMYFLVSNIGEFISPTMLTRIKCLPVPRPPKNKNMLVRVVCPGLTCLGLLYQVLTIVSRTILNIFYLLLLC